MLLPLMLVSIAMAIPSSAFTTNSQNNIQITISSSPSHLLSTWDDFAFDDEDDELLDSGVDSDFIPADENDEAAVKAVAGMSLEAPDVDYDGPMIDVPQGQLGYLITWSCLMAWDDMNQRRMHIYICMYAPLLH